MQAPSTIRGVICPMVTPLDAEGQIDERATRRLIDFLLARGVDVLFPAGTNGEGLLFSLDERRRLAEIVVQHVAGRVPVILHTGCLSTRDTIALTQHARDTGATAAAVVVPYFYSFDDQSLEQHFIATATAVSDLPIFVYSIPGNAKNELSGKGLERVRQGAANVIGIKLSSPDLARFQEYISVCGANFIPLCGNDSLALAALAVGSFGQVSGNANVFPELLQELHTSFLSGDLATARSKQRTLDHARRLMGQGAHPAYYKAGLSLRGVPVGGVRPPMRALTASELRTLEIGLRDLGII